jgi:hypothetical protein
MALTKTTTIDEIDAWQSVAAGLLAVGNAEDISACYAAMLYIEAALIEAVASDGVEIIVEVSYADDNWVKLTEFKGTAETPEADDLDGLVSAGGTTVTLTDAATGEFDVNGRKWLIWESGTPANSESVRTKSVAANVVTLCQDLLRGHADAIPTYDRVDEWVIELPFAASQVRVLLNNVDADCDAAFTTRISKVTAV